MSITRGHSVLPVLASPPSTPDVGEAYFDSTLGVPRWWTGTSWMTPGTGGGGGAAGYTHVQSSAASVWNVNHNLGRDPVVTVIDSTNEQVWADIDYVDPDNLTITFVGSLGGRAYMI